VDPTTGQPSGAPYSAEVMETHLSELTDGFQRASSNLFQALLPVGQSGHGRLDVRLLIDSRGTARGETGLRCTP
jgi:hypothetical protein